MATMKYDGGAARDAKPAPKKAQPVKVEAKPTKFHVLNKAVRSYAIQTGRMSPAKAPDAKPSPAPKPRKKEATVKPSRGKGKLPIDTPSKHATRRIYRGDDGKE